MATAPPARTTGLRDEIATALSIGRELGPEFDTEVADSLAARMESETAPKREGEPERSGSATRSTRALRVAGWGALGIATAAWAAESAPEALSPWAILAVVAVVLHVVRTWRS
ncbi:hypothetical protein [Nocardiopsis deserti]|uniref:hypothetical protein n=1 Tax=Nocardiopsis deserti TaxID=2605988 RepID=UPI00123B8173|nr:hypothetical protein [Nocardiopsis deserti]